MRFSGSTRVRGSGLGLAIAHKLAQALGGELRIEAPPQGGTHACFSLERAAEIARPQPVLTAADPDD